MPELSEIRSHYFDISVSRTAAFDGAVYPVGYTASKPEIAFNTQNSDRLITGGKFLNWVVYSSFDSLEIIPTKSVLPDDFVNGRWYVRYTDRATGKYFTTPDPVTLTIPDGGGVIGNNEDGEVSATTFEWSLLCKSIDWMRLDIIPPPASIVSPVGTILTTTPSFRLQNLVLPTSMWAETVYDILLYSTVDRIGSPVAAVYNLTKADVVDAGYSYNDFDINPTIHSGTKFFGMVVTRYHGNEVMTYFEFTIPFSVPTFSLENASGTVVTELYEGLGLVISIDEVFNATKYRIEISDTSVFASVLEEIETTQVSSIMIPAWLGRRYIRVRAESLTTVSSWANYKSIDVKEYPVTVSAISDITIGRGSNISFLMWLTRPLSGATSAHMSLHNPVSGISATFAPADVVGNSTQITLYVDASVAPGTYSVTVKLTTPQGGVDMRSFSLTVQYGYIEISQCWLDPTSVFSIDSNGRCSAWENLAGKQVSLRGVRTVANQQPFVSNIAQANGGIYVPDSEENTAKGFEVHGLTTQAPVIFTFVGTQRFYLYNNFLFGNSNISLQDGHQYNWGVKIGSATYNIAKHFSTGGVPYTVMPFSVICLLLTPNKLTVYSSSSKISATKPDLVAHSGVIPSYSDLYLLTSPTPTSSANSCCGGALKAFGVSNLPAGLTDQQYIDLYLTPNFDQLRSRFL